MIGEKSGKVSGVSAVHSSPNVKSREPLVERVKKRVKRIGKKAAFAGLAGLSMLMLRPAIVTAQDVAMSIPTGAKTEQTVKSRLTIDQFEIGLNQLEGEMKKETNPNNAGTMRAILDGIERGGGKIIDGTDTLMGVVKGSICDVSSTPPSQKYFRKLGLSEDNFLKSVKNGGLKFLIVDMDTGSTKMSVFVHIINGSRIVGAKSNTEIDITFYDKNDENKGYNSILSCPNGCEVSNITPFFGMTKDGVIQFGMYLKYIKDGRENKMVNYFMYSIGDKNASVMYFARDKNDPNSILSASLDYSKI
jgi:hypothetical protein